MDNEEMLQIFMTVAQVYELNDRKVQLAAIINGNNSKLIDMENQNGSIN